MATDRDNKGRFLNGAYKGGPGNPINKRINEYRKALYSAITQEDIKAVYLAIRDAALNGDMVAAKLLLAYACGSPRNIDEVEVDGERLTNFKIIFETRPAIRLTGTNGNGNGNGNGHH